MGHNRRASVVGIDFVFCYKDHISGGMCLLETLSRLSSVDINTKMLPVHIFNWEFSPFVLRR